MAQWTITRSCGHQTTEQLYGPNADRERKAAWLRTEPCLSCRQAAETAMAAASGLPTLSGSPKQVAWATSIRAEKLAALTDFLAQQTQRPALSSEALAVLHQAEELAAEIARLATAAGWSIDHRYDSAVDLLRYQAQVAAGRAG